MHEQAMQPKGIPTPALVAVGVALAVLTYGPRRVIGDPRPAPRPLTHHSHPVHARHSGCATKRTSRHCKPTH